jgi:aconitase A
MDVVEVGGSEVVDVRMPEVVDVRMPEVVDVRMGGYRLNSTKPSPRSLSPY